MRVVVGCTVTDSEAAPVKWIVSAAARGSGREIRSVIRRAASDGQTVIQPVRVSQSSERRPTTSAASRTWAPVGAQRSNGATIPPALLSHEPCVRKRRPRAAAVDEHGTVDSVLLRT